MGRKIVGFSIEDSIGYVEATCVLKYDDVELVTDEFETPYDYQVLIDIDEETEEIHSLGVDGADKLLKVIDNEDCLPDVGLLDYKDDDLGLDLKDVTLRELYKNVLNKVLN